MVNELEPDAFFDIDSFERYVKRLTLPRGFWEPGTASYTCGQENPYYQINLVASRYTDERCTVYWHSTFVYLSYNRREFDFGRDTSESWAKAIEKLTAIESLIKAVHARYDDIDGMYTELFTAQAPVSRAAPTLSYRQSTIPHPIFANQNRLVMSTAGAAWHRVDHTTAVVGAPVMADGVPIGSVVAYNARNGTIDVALADGRVFRHNTGHL